MSYQHLALEERHYIETQWKLGVSQNRIAQALGRSQSSVSRELSRNRGFRGYRYKQANSKARERHAVKPKAVKMTTTMKSGLESLLREDWSPEQIAGRLKQQGQKAISHETIYRYVLQDKHSGGDLFLHLRRHRKKYRKRYGGTGNSSGIPNRVDIEARPEVANRRGRLGDWEADTMIGKGHQGALVTLEERKSKLRLAWPVDRKTAEAVTEAIVTLLDGFKDFVHTLTFDNGKEFARHETLAKELNCHTYFAKPYHSWERGQNENANGLLRQYFPKTIGLLEVTQQQVLQAVHKLNSRPRKGLGFKTPYEVFRQFAGVDAEKISAYALIS